MSNLIDKLQTFMRNSEVYKELFQAQEIEVNNRTALIEDLEKQLAVSTATWALEIYERETGLPVDYTKPYSERRSMIMAKLRGTGKVGAELIKSVIKSWTGGDVEVAFNAGTISINFVDVTGIPTNIEDVKVAIEEIKPAHLAVLYVFIYNTWAEVEEFTWGELEVYFTWEEVMSSDLT